MRIDPTKNETPTPSTASGVSCEQSELFGTPQLCPSLPTKGTRAWHALMTLAHRDLTQLDWLRMGYGWRLAATIKHLDYCGWQPRSLMVDVPDCAAQIARYSLSEQAKRTLFTLLQGGKA